MRSEQPDAQLAERPAPMRPSVFVRNFPSPESFADVVAPCLCPLPQPGDCLLVEPVGGAFRVTDPVGSALSCLQVAQIEGATDMAPSELLGFGWFQRFTSVPMSRCPGEQRVR